MVGISFISSIRSPAVENLPLKIWAEVMGISELLKTTAKLVDVCSLQRQKRLIES